MTSRVQAAPTPLRLRIGRLLNFDIVVALVSLALCAVILIPIVVTLGRVLTGGEGSVAEAIDRTFGNARIGTIIIDTVVVVGFAVILSVVLGSLLAWLNERTNASLGWLSDVLPLVSLLVPSTAGAIGWLLLASPGVGYLNNIGRMLESVLPIGLPELNVFTRPGMIFVFSLYLIPQVYLVVSAAMRNIDPALEEAARVSGRGTLTVLRTVTLPVVAPAIISGGLLALIYGLAMFSIPLILGAQQGITLLTVEIVRLVTVNFPPDMVGAVLLSLLLVLVVVSLSALSRRFALSGRHATIAGKGGGQSAHHFGRLGLTVTRAFMIGYIIVGCILPTAALALVSFQPYWTGDFSTNFQLDSFRRVFAPGSQTLQALQNSLTLAVLGGTLCMLLAVLVVHTIGNHKRIGSYLSAVTRIPGTLSNVFLAIAILAFFAGPPLRWGGTFMILLFAYVIIYITQATVSTESAALQVGSDLKEASRVSGRGSGETLRRITLPLMLPGLVAGWVFVFVLIMGDITASAILAGPNNPVVGFTMVSLFQNGTYTTLATLALIVTLLSTTVVATALIWTNRNRAKFRK